MLATHWRSLAASAIITSLMLSGCTTLSLDKAGADTVVLKFATIDGSISPTNQYVGNQVFLESLAELSGGRMRVETTTTWGDGRAEAESELVSAIAKGDLDGGWPAARAFQRAGIPGLEALEAPMLITSAAAEKALVVGPIADKALSRLKGTGILGVGLVVGPLRRPFASGGPLLGPDEWHRVRFRVYNSQLQADVVRSFGATPVNVGLEWLDRIHAGMLDGGEFDISQAGEVGDFGALGNVTANVVLWPKIFVLSFSQKRFDSLTGQEQEWVREAAARAVLASSEADYDESSVAQMLCGAGVRFVDADPGQIAMLRRGAESVLRKLEAGEGEGADSLVADIRTLAEQYPDTDVPDVPAFCREPGGAEPAPSPMPEEAAGIPDGLYRVDITTDDVLRSGRSLGPGWSGTWTLDIRHGMYALSCRPIANPGKDCGNVMYTEKLPFHTTLDAGFVRGSGDTVYFVYDAAFHSSHTGCALPCDQLPTYRLTWTLNGDRLHFEDPVGVAPGDKVIKDWTKIG